MPVLSARIHLRRSALLGLYALLLPLASHAAPALCPAGRDLAFVGHMDDDLLFMNPDLSKAIQDGACVQVVYLTASERKGGLDYMHSRERGVRAAYAYMANQADDWREERLSLDGYSVTQFTLRGHPAVQLTHLRLQDPWLGQGWGSLTPLSQAESMPGHVVKTLDAPEQSYTRKELVQTLAALIRLYRPTTIRYLDDTNPIPYTKLCWRCPGHGHPDHIASARLVRDAMAAVPGHYAQVGYLDYPTQEHERNLSLTEIQSKTDIFRRYAWKDGHYCKGPENCQEPAGPAAAWVQRAYYASRHNTGAELMVDASGQLTLFAAGEQNDAANQWNPATRRWSSLGGRTADALTAFHYPDAATGLFARDATGGVWVNRQHADGQWRGWQALAGARLLRPPVVASEVSLALGMGTDRRFYWSAPSGLNHGWTPWQALPALDDADGQAAIVADAQGRAHVFAVTQDGRLFHTRQQADRHWQPWHALSAPSSNGGLAAIRNAQGQIELYLRDRQSQRLLRLIGQADGSRWGQAHDTGVVYIGRPALALDEQRQVVAAVQEAPGGAILLIEASSVTRLQEHASSQPALREQHGILYMASRPVGPVQSYRLLARRQGVWSQIALIDTLPSGGGSSFAATPEPSLNAQARP
ncbi:PIG-L family deacetylase [Alcaligenes sp. SDU_A2]|uniref:PIG-L family deacetylase n=1 Tax=Alcaligenes sp. SDU_A2 TaxID=3136634 RepID=UPI003120060F